MRLGRCPREMILDCFAAIAMTKCRAGSRPALVSFQQGKPFARRVGSSYVARRQREHAIEIRARVPGVGQLHVEDTAIDKGDLVFQIEQDPLIVSLLGVSFCPLRSVP